MLEELVWEKRIKKRSVRGKKRSNKIYKKPDNVAGKKKEEKARSSRKRGGNRMRAFKKNPPPPLG